VWAVTNPFSMIQIQMFLTQSGLTSLVSGTTTAMPPREEGIP
jgi:hypothetical protein